MLLRLLETELFRVIFEGSCALHRFVTVSDRFIMALWTNPPSPFVGDDGRSGESRRWVGDGGNCSSVLDSVFGGSNLCTLDNGSGEPSPVAVDTDDMLEYRLLTVLSPKVELALEGERDRSSTFC